MAHMGHNGCPKEILIGNQGNSRTQHVSLAHNKHHDPASSVLNSDSPAAGRNANNCPPIRSRSVKICAARHSLAHVQPTHSFDANHSMPALSNYPTPSINQDTHQSPPVTITSARPTSHAEPPHETSNVHQRKPRKHNRCVTCKMGPTRIDCNGSPLCRTCVETVPDTKDMNWCSHMLNLVQSLHLWSGFDWCKLPATSPMWQLQPICLVFQLGYKYQQDSPDLHVSICEQAGDTSAHTECANCRRPIINMEQLDQVAKACVRGQAKWQLDTKRLAPNDADLWQTILLFTGYLIFTQHTIFWSVQTLDQDTMALRRTICTEIIYAAEWRLQQLFDTILQSGRYAIEARDRPLPTQLSTLFYCLEIAIIALIEMQKIDADFRTQPNPERSSDLVTHIGSRNESFVNLLRHTECQLTQIHEHLRSSRRKKLNPSLKKLREFEKYFVLPQEYTITMYTATGPFANSWDYGRHSIRKFPVTDVYKHSTGQEHNTTTESTDAATGCNMQHSVGDWSYVYPLWPNYHPYNTSDTTTWYTSFDTEEDVTAAWSVDTWREPQDHKTLQEPSAGFNDPHLC